MISKFSKISVFIKFHKISKFSKNLKILKLKTDNKLAIPEYTVYKYFIIPKHIRFIVEWSPQNDKDQ
jgi:hypothetical protein